MDKQEAIKILKEFHDTSALFSVRTALETVFPELKESEDERIRKALIRFHKSTIDVDGIKGEDIIAWLEKQGEQNTADKVEPKFKVGDLVVNNNSEGVCQVTEIKGDEYCIWPLYDEMQGYLRIIDVDNDYHLWTIEDAKNGDVLASGDVIFIFNKIHGVWVNCLCTLHKDGSFIDEDYDLMHIKYSKEVYPATNEQRELLFQKMKEAGYEWDNEKKELKIIDWSKHVKYEPNSPSIIEENTEWSEEDVRNIENIDAVLFYDKDLPEDTCMRLRNWLKSLKQRIGG